MNHKLKEIMLIDDDESTNFINKIILSKTECAEQIVAIESAKKALETLNQRSDQQPSIPELIFLDINMPAMDGWEFLEKYKNLPVDYTRDIKVIMLSTSVNPDDQIRANKIPEVVDYKSKPLTMEMAREIMDNYF